MKIMIPPRNKPKRPRLRVTLPEALAFSTTTNIALLKKRAEEMNKPALLTMEEALLEIQQS